jgi:uncharacterized Tic20 family protein
MNEHPAIQREDNKQARTWGMLCHLAALLGFIGPLLNILGPFVVWLLKKNEFSFVDEQGKESMNFQISMTLLTLLAALLIVVKIGIVLLFAVGIVDVIFVVIASVKTSNGERYQYPFKIRLIK